jgi:hypothetical protein
MVGAMTIPRALIATAATCVAALIPASASHAAARPPIKDCGDVATIDKDHVFIGAVTAQGAACTIARTVARSASCRRKGSCRVRSYTCLLAKAGRELTLVHCENPRQTAFIRFEFGA